jgi:hypothetical protein
VKSNFAPSLGRKNSGTMIDARGWIFWDEIPDDVQTIRVAATIAQSEDDSTDRCGTGWSDPYQRPSNGHPTRMDWDCDVPEDEGREFNPGASLAGGALVSSSPAWVWPWGDDPDVT